MFIVHDIKGRPLDLKIFGCRIWILWEFVVLWPHFDWPVFHEYLCGLLWGCIRHVFRGYSGRLRSWH